MSGADCCAPVPGTVRKGAAAAIEQTLGEWRGVERIEVDEAHGKVAVTLAGEQADGADLLWSLRMLGLDAVENSKRDPIDSDISIHRYD